MAHALRKPLPPADPHNPRVYVDVCIGAEEEPAGRLILELFVERAPREAENFRLLATGERGVCARTGLALRLAGAAVQRIAAGEALELACGAAALGGHPSDAAHCARDEPGVPDPASRLPHDRAGLLSCEMLTCEHASDNSGTFQFTLTLGRVPSRDRASPRPALVFGRLLRGYGLLRHLEALPTNHTGEPIATVRITASGELLPGDDGVVMGPDGDPFPGWPQDYPGLSADSGEGFAGRCAACETIRALGNEAFAAKDWRTAAAKYAKALRYLERRYTREAETAVEEEQARKSVCQLALPLHLNSAAALLKLKDWRGVVTHCDAVHQLENEGAQERAPFGAAPVERWNAKALYRRGTALSRLKEFDQAEADLARAAALAPTDAAVRAELAATRKAAAEHKQRTRAAFAAAFGA